MKSLRFGSILTFLLYAITLNAQILAKYSTVGKEFLNSGEANLAFYSFSEGDRVNNTDTRYYLAQCYENGWGTDIDLSKAFAYYRKAAESGNDDAKVKVAIMLAEGIGADPNPQKAKYYVDKLLMSKKKEGYFLKGYFQIEGIVYPKDVTSGLELLQKAIEKEDEEACLYLAFKLISSPDVQRDAKQAADLIEKVCALSPNNYLYLDKKGEFLLALGQNAQAQALWNELIGKSPAYAIEFNSPFANAMRKKVPISASTTNSYNSSRDYKLSLLEGDKHPSSSKSYANQTATPIAKQSQPVAIVPEQKSIEIAARPIEIKDNEKDTAGYPKTSSNSSMTSSSVMVSDIDSNIPTTNKVNESCFAVVIANENYQDVATVPYANHDGEMFALYCQKALGLPESNVHLVKDATLNNIKREINWLKNVSAAYKGEAKIIFYYAGHGIPSEESKASYILPVDGFGTDITTGYPLDELYTTLGTMPAKEVTVFLDACFSGASRDGGMVASARGIAIAPKKSSLSGNVVVFAAAQNDETAYPLKGEGHGLFTYYLLKKLQQSKGEATLQSIADYVIDNVSKKSIVVNGKSQTPCMSSAPNLSGAWQNWTLK